MSRECLTDHAPEVAAEAAFGGAMISDIHGNVEYAGFSS